VEGGRSTTAQEEAPSLFFCFWSAVRVLMSAQLPLPIHSHTLTHTHAHTYTQTETDTLLSSPFRIKCAEQKRGMRRNDCV
jgi:hypothetical protein